MKRILPILLFIFIPSVLLAQAAGGTIKRPNQYTNRSKSLRNTKNDSSSKKITLKGDAQGFPIMLQLTIDDDNVTGTYKNIQYGTQMKINGTYVKGMSMRLSGFADGTEYIFLLSEIGNGIFSGTFSSKNGKALKVKLFETY